ncbi:MAG: M56 family metallopeptidase [Actinomycetota bacterium]
MIRLAILVATLALFSATPRALSRLPISSRWSARLAFLSMVGLLLSTVSILAAVLLPEVLVVSKLSEIWSKCFRAFEAIFTRPFGRLPSLGAGILLAILVGRFVWSLFMGARATRRARVTGGEPRWRLARGEPVYVLPVDRPAAYSLGWIRGQAVVSRGLLDTLDEDERQAVLLHEEAHLRGHHHLLLVIGRAIRRSLWPLPATRAALDLLERALEESADDYAARRLGSPAIVASGLSKAALAGIGGPVGVLSLARELDVPARVRRLLAPTALPSWAPVVAMALLALLLGAIAVTQAVAGLAVLAAVHHVVGLGTAATCPLSR